MPFSILLSRSERSAPGSSLQPNTVVIVKDIPGSKLLTEMSAQFYYRYIQVSKIMLMHESILAFVGSLNSDDAESKLLGISYLQDVRLYRATAVEPLVVGIEANHFINNPNEPSAFPAPKLYSSAKIFVAELGGCVGLSPYKLYFMNCTVFVRVYGSYEKTNIFLLLMSFSCICLQNFDPKDTKQALKTCSEGFQCRFIQNAQSFFSDSYPVQLDVQVIENAADSVPYTTRRRRRRYLRDDTEDEDVSVLREVLQSGSRKAYVLGAKK